MSTARRPGLEAPAAPSDLSYLPNPSMADFADAWIVAGPPEARQRLPVNAANLARVSPVLHEALLLGRGAVEPCQLETPFSSCPLPLVKAFLRLAYNPHQAADAGAVAALSDAGHLGPLLALCHQLQADGILASLAALAQRGDAPIRLLADWAAFIHGASSDEALRQAAWRRLGARLARGGAGRAGGGTDGRDLAYMVERCGSSVVGNALACALPCTTESPLCEFAPSSGSTSDWQPAGPNGCEFNAFGFKWRLSLCGDDKGLFSKLQCLSPLDGGARSRACAVRFSLRASDGSMVVSLPADAAQLVDCWYGSLIKWNADILAPAGITSTTRAVMLSARIKLS